MPVHGACFIVVQIDFSQPGGVTRTFASNGNQTRRDCAELTFELTLAKRVRNAFDRLIELCNAQRPKDPF